MAFPVWHLLGGLRSTVPTYGSCAEYMPADKLAERRLSILPPDIVRSR
jgi:L-alanine-DL-glutamate epimerase-like enolase superfamily enzyme